MSQYDEMKADIFKACLHTSSISEYIIIVTAIKFYLLGIIRNTYSASYSFPDDRHFMI